MNSPTLFRHEKVVRFQNLPGRIPERSKEPTLRLRVVSSAFTITCSTNQIKSTRTATVAFYRGQIALKVEGSHRPGQAPGSLGSRPNVNGDYHWNKHSRGGKAATLNSRHQTLNPKP